MSFTNQTNDVFYPPQQPIIPTTNDHDKETISENRSVVELVLNTLLEEAQKRFTSGATLTPEEVKAWIDSRRVHWFANI